MTRFARIQPIVAVALLLTGPARAQAPTAVREALGGDGRLRGLKGLHMTGTVLSGFNGATAQPLDDVHSVDIRVAFPDKYLRAQEMFGTLSRIGFNGNAPISELRSTRPGVTVAGDGPDATFVKRAQVRIARLLLGMIGDPKGILDLRVVPKPAIASALAVSGAGDFRAEIDLDRKTQLPLRVRYPDSLFIRVPLTAEDKKARRMSAGQTESVEVVISFEDRRRVDGLLLPHRIVTTVKGVRWEDLRFDRIIVNPVLTPADFK